MTWGLYRLINKIKLCILKINDYKSYVEENSVQNHEILYDLVYPEALIQYDFISVSD